MARQKRSRGRPRGRPRRVRSKSSLPVVNTPPVRVKRKQWSNESMLAAMEAVKNGTSVSRAALEHGVPRTTLQDRHLGKVTHGTKPGPQPYLDKTEEKELHDFIVVVGQIGYPKTRGQIKNIAESVAREKGVLQKSKDGFDDLWNEIVLFHYAKVIQQQVHVYLPWRIKVQ